MINKLLEGLQSKDSAIVISSIKALVEIERSGRIAGALMKLLDHRDENIFKETVIALGKIKDPGSIQPLISKLSSIPPFIGFDLHNDVITTSLIAIGKPALPYLVEASKTSAPYAKKSIMMAIKELEK